MKKMNDTDELVIGKLKELIDKNGPEYLTDKPHAVYKELEKTAQKNTIMAGAILMLLVSGIWDCAKLINNNDELSKKIQKDCCFNKKMSDRLANIILALYSADNKTEWEKKQGEGLEQFLGKEHTFKWDGFSVWDAGNGTVDCFYSAEMVLCPTKISGRNKELQKLLKKNPFMTTESVYQFYERMLKEYLDSEFEEYCTNHTSITRAGDY